MPTSLLRSLLLVTVFITGACVLVLEILATRLLAPHFGNTLYSLSSVLGVTLGALSVGYVVGGLLADRKPLFSYFFSIIVLAGISILVTKMLGLLLLPGMSASLSVKTGPLFASLLLFFVPCALLGTLSPYTITLAHQSARSQGIGSTSGIVFFVSTVGSILGSFAAGFSLLPAFGVQQILTGLGVLLILIGIAGIFLMRDVKGMIVQSLLLTVAVVTTGISSVVQGAEPPSTLYAHDGVYQFLRVFEGHMQDRPVRFLLQDRNLSSGMFLDGDDLTFGYTHGYRFGLLHTPEPRRALFLGAGAYSMPKHLHQQSPSTEIDVVDIEPGLEFLAREYFELPITNAIRSHITDARQFLAHSSASYDLLFSDVYGDLHSIPAHVATKEFFALAREKLSERGVLIANVIGSLTDDQPSFVPSEMRTFRSVFPRALFLAVDSASDDRIQNLLFVGCKKDEDCLALCADEFASARDAMLERLCRNEIHLTNDDLAGSPLLTDDHAPVEYLAARSVQK